MNEEASRPSDGGWTRTSHEWTLATPWMRVRCDHIVLPSGEPITYHVLEHDGWALVVPMLDDDRVVVERIYRWPLQDWPLEFPAGGLDGDAPEAGARRELEEETGYKADRLEHLGCFATSSGHSNERFHVFLARDVRAEGQQALEATEQIEVEVRSLRELRQSVLAGELPDAPTALAILLAWERLHGAR